MSYTAFTALIFSIHHLSAVATLIIAATISLVIFLIFIKGRPYRALKLSATVLCALMIGEYLAEGIFEKQAVSLEIVQAG